MDPRVVIANIIGGLAYAIMFYYSYANVNRNMILILNVAANILFAIQYIVLKAYTGAICCGFAVIHYYLYSFKGKNKFFKTLTTPIICIMVYIVFGILTWDGPLSLLPVMCNLIAATVYWFDKEIIIKWAILPMCVLWTIYNSQCSSFVGVIFQVILFTLDLIFIIKFYKKKKQDKKISLEE